MPNQHTPEPWLTGQPEVGFTHDVDNHVYPDLPEQDLALLPLPDYRRAISCVNACAGIVDPAETLKAVREALEYVQPILDVLGRTGRCPEGGEQTGNRMHIWEASKIIHKTLSLLPATTEATPI